MIFKAIDDMGREALITEEFKIEFKKQLKISQACEDFYFGEGNNRPSDQSSYLWKYSENSFP